MDQRVIDTVESLIHNTTGRIRDVQSNLIPFFNKGIIKQVEYYKMYNTPYQEDYTIYNVPFIEDYIDRIIYNEFPEVGEIGNLYVNTETKQSFRWNGSEYILIDYEHQTFIAVSDLKFKDTITPQKYRGVFRVSMNKAVMDNIIHPFLLFINGKVIKWSNIEIVHDLHYTYLIANGSYYPEANKIDILQFPFNIYYNEDGNIKENTELMFSFTDDGKFSELDAGNIVISYDSSISDIKMNTFDAPIGNILGWDVLSVKDNVKLFPENFILFKNILLTFILLFIIVT